MVLQLNAITLGVIVVVAIGTIVYNIWGSNRQHGNYHKNNYFRDSDNYFEKAETNESERKKRCRKTKCENCTICLFPMEKQLKTLSCKHIFHTSCIDEWFEKNRSCPNCRKVY